MARNTDSNSLLSSLRSLYGKLAIVMHGIRAGVYSKSSHSRNISNLILALEKQIEDLANKLPDESDIHISKSSTKIASGAARSDTNNHQVHSIDNAKYIENELGKHLKNSRTTTGNRNIVEKLQDSIWEHIHTSLRLAKSGNEEKARLHISIMEQALEEISHYMEENDYIAFVDHIEQYLVNLDKE